MGILDWIAGRKRKSKELPHDTKPHRENIPLLDQENERMRTIIEELEKERKRNRMQKKKMKEMESRLKDINSSPDTLSESRTYPSTNGSSTGPVSTEKMKQDLSKPRSKDGYDNRIISNKIFERFASPIIRTKVFGNFVVDDSNRFPYLAAEAVATNEGRKYNPLFIFGPVGVGKTHLLHAIANRMKKNQQDIRLLYSSTEKFTEVMIESLKMDDIASFRKMYREVDVLLVDDIQMLSGKEATQKEFFHMFNYLYNSGKQIVLCSDRPPGEIKELESRLRSRFEGGLIIDMEVPTFEGRRQILLNLSQREGFSLSSEVLDYLSLYLDSSVRELEGGFNRVTAYASLMKEPVTVSLIRKVLDVTLHRKEIPKREMEVDLVKEITGEDKYNPEMEAEDRLGLDFEEETDMIEKELLFELKKQSIGED